LDFWWASVKALEHETKPNGSERVNEVIHNYSFYAMFTITHFLDKTYSKNTTMTSLAATMVRWCEGGVNQGLLPMTISEEESNSFCACQLLKHWYIVNGERQK
jgi:hypothetical protein